MQSGGKQAARSQIEFSDRAYRLAINLIFFVLKDQQTLHADVESRKERCARDAKWHFYVEAYRHVRNS